MDKKDSFAQLKKVFNQSFPDDDKKASFCLTILSAADMIIQCLPEVGVDPLSLPLKGLYGMGLVGNGIFVAKGLPEKVRLPSEDLQKYFESSDIDERFTMLVKQMYLLLREQKRL